VGRLRPKRTALERALAGQFGPHQRFLLGEQLCHIDALDEMLERINAEVTERLRPEQEAIERLDGVPGIGRRLAEILVAEVGTDMSHFPTAGHLASWAGMCPGNNQSGGKRLNSKARQGNRWLKTALVEAAQAAGRTRGTYLGAQFRRLAARMGRKKAAIAVGHSILVCVWHLLHDGTTYQDLGGGYFDERDRLRIEQRLVQRLQRLGYRVALEPVASGASAA
jgi:transposase